MTQQINGWLSLNKPEGMSSARAVSVVKKILNVKKIGHAGTLDPLAEGVLPLAIGEATKSASYVVGARKQYDFEVRWGKQTSTDDREGEVINSSDMVPSRELIEQSLPYFVGDISQIPPIYSAIKIKGKRACDLARKGESVEMKPRQVQVVDFKLAKHGEKNSRFFVECSKGTYIRSLARDLATKMGTFAHVTMLRRIKVGKFSIKDAILLETLEKKLYKGKACDFITPIGQVLDDIPVLDVDKKTSLYLRDGRKIECHVDSGYVQGQMVALLCSGDIVAFGEFDGAYIRPRRVFNCFNN